MSVKFITVTLVAIALYMVPTQSAIGEEKVCTWRGVAPFCKGRCPVGWTEEERDKQGPSDSKKCATGTKAYCCFVEVTEVFGKAPVCAGKCPAGWTLQGDSDVGENGQKCITGKAAVCSKDIN
jgi:chitinase